MKTTEREKLDIEKKQLSLKNMYFNRYLGIRYLTAGFFFMNLNWLVFLMLAGSSWLAVPLALLLVTVPAVWEQFKLYGQHKNTVPWTKFYFGLQFLVNGLLAITAFFSSFQYLFPFMNQGIQGRTLILVVVLSGMALCGFVEVRLKKISTDHDRHYLRIKQYEKALHL